MGEGSLECTKIIEGEKTFLTNYGPGGAFGELALLYNAPRAASIQATSDCVLYALGRRTFNHIVKDSVIKKREKYMEFLKKIEILSELKEYEKEKLCDCLKRETFHQGDQIIKEGDEGNIMYLIQEGSVVAKIYDKERDEDIQVNKLQEQDYFGELALIRDQPRKASIYAEGEVVLASIDRTTFRRLLGPIEEIFRRNEAKYKTLADF